jgi:hypothetical protein
LEREPRFPCKNRAKIKEVAVSAGFRPGRATPIEAFVKCPDSFHAIFPKVFKIQRRDVRRPVSGDLS